MIPRRSPRLLLAFLSLLAVAATACGPSIEPLANTHKTSVELAAAVLAALERKDLAALRGLALDEREFRELVWPELPAARPERNLPVSYVWGDLHQKSEASLAHTLATSGGQRHNIVSVKFLGGTTPYKSYLVRRRAELTVRDAAGVEQRIRLFGSVIDKGGRLKVFSYVVDDN